MAFSDEQHETFATAYAEAEECLGINTLGCLRAMRARKIYKMLMALENGLEGDFSAYKFEEDPEVCPLDQPITCLESTFKSVPGMAPEDTPEV